MDRRTFLARGSALGAATAAASAFGAVGPWAAVARARARTSGTVLDPTGTTLERTLVPVGEGYRRFTEGPGEPFVVRDELAAPRRGREERRAALATIVHLTDVHVVDAQSPTRVEFTDRLDDPSPAATGALTSAWRPQETLTGHVADAMIRALRAIGAGPVTGRPFDAAVTTGDSTDNQQHNELAWFLDLLDGGRPVSVNSGDPDRYEGVQDADGATFDPAYWHPDATGRVDRYKVDLGFPDRPELLDAAIAAFTPVGLPCPWYSVYGNHDGLIQGNALANPGFDAVATGPLKVVGLPDGLSPSALSAILADADLGRLLTVPHAPVRLVTPDARRAAVSPRGWVDAHRADRGGPGPVGHGLSADAADTGELHYTFPLGDDVLGIALDTVNRTAYASGSLDRAQFAWLERQLIAASSRYLDASGREVRTGNDDRYVVLFAHHGTGSLDNPLPDLARPETEPRVQGPELVALLHRFPNVVALVVGHTHRNEVVAHAPAAGTDTGGFWEVTTAAHVDHPQQARLLELADNGDGTLSLFGTIVDHAGPARPPEVATDVLGLAALSRELGLNDAQSGGSGTGGPADRNVELVLPAPFVRVPVAPPAGRPDVGQPAPPAGTPTGPPASPPPTSPAAPSTDRPAAVPAGSGGVRGSGGGAAVDAAAAGRPLPTTGGGALAAGAGLLTAAAALARQSRSSVTGNQIATSSRAAPSSTSTPTP